jgi:hypothetical protein
MGAARKASKPRQSITTPETWLAREQRPVRPTQTSGKSPGPVVVSTLDPPDW